MLAGPPASLAALLGYIEEAQWLPPEQILEKQMEQLIALTFHANQHSEFFRNRMQKAQLRPTEDPEFRLEKLPAIAVADAPQGFPDFQGIVVLQRHAAKTTCQSMGDHDLPVRRGEPVMVKKTAVTQMLWMAITMREQVWHQLDRSGRMFLIRARVPKPVIQEGWGPPTSLLFHP